MINNINNLYITKEMQTAALASGSSGNSFFIESNKVPLLIDAGISCKQIEQRMGDLGKDASQLKGIFITHEHTDHIKGVDVLARKYEIPVFITSKCYESCRFSLDDNLVRFIERDKLLNLGNIRVLPFSKSHDANDPVSYTVFSNNKKVSVITDIGFACKNVVSNIQDSNVAFLESNHDINMLVDGPYPKYLKERILSKEGHLSNYAASLLVLEHASSSLKHLVLSHLSENNNTEEIALKTMKGMIDHRKDLKSLKVHLSGRHNPTELISI